MHLAASRGMALSLLLTVAVGLSQSDIRAQQTAPADTVNPHRAQPERPTVATHAGTVAPGWVEMEMGGQRSDGNDRLSVQAPVVAKIGLASHMQLSVFGDWVSTSGHDARAEGVGDAAVGVKWRLVDGAPVVGDFAILPTIKVPTGARGTGTGTTDLGLLLLSSHDFGPIALDVNAGYTHRSGSGRRAPRSATLWAVAGGAQVWGPLGWTGELSGFPGTGGPTGQSPIIAALTGPTWTAREWLVFDAGVSPALRGPQATYIYAGLTWNVGRL